MPFRLKLFRLYSAFLSLWAPLTPVLAFAATPPDAIVSTRTDAETLDWMIHTSKVLMLNTGKPDLFKGAVPADKLIPIQFTSDQFFSSPSSALLGSRIESLSKVALKDISATFTIPAVSYELGAVDPRVLSVESTSSDLILNLQVTIKGLKVELPQGISALVDAQKVKFRGAVSPTKVTIPESLEMPFDLKVKVSRGALSPDKFQMEVLAKDFSKLKTALSEHAADIQVTDMDGKNFNFDQITLVPFYIRIGDAKKDFTKDTIRPLIEEKLPLLIQNAIQNAVQSMNIAADSKLFETTFETAISSPIAPKADDVYSRFLLQDFTQTGTSHLGIEIGVDVCTGESFLTNKENCVKEDFGYQPIRKYSASEDLKARAEIGQILDDKEANAILSLSEGFLNRAVAVSTNTTLWDKTLEEMNLTLGPRGAIVYLNPQTKRLELVLHLEYVGEGLERLVATRKRPLRFPLRIQTDISIAMHDKSKEGHENVPALEITAKEIVSDIDEVAFGISEWDMDSRLKLPGFKRILAKKVLKMADDVVGKKLFEIELDLFRQSGLENTKIEVSQNGRLNVLIRNKP